MIITIPRNISYCLTAIFGHPSSSACHWSQIGWLNILQSLQSKSLHCNSGSPKDHVISLDLIGTYYYVKLVWFCPLECHTWSSPKFPCRNHVFKQQSASPRPMLAHGDRNARAETVVCVSSECCNQMVSTWNTLSPTTPTEDTIPMEDWLAQRFRSQTGSQHSPQLHPRISTGRPGLNRTWKCAQWAPIAHGPTVIHHRSFEHSVRWPQTHWNMPTKQVEILHTRACAHGSAKFNHAPSLTVS